MAVKFGMQMHVACRCMPTVCNTWAGSYVDRCHRSEENEHLIKLSNVKKLAVNKLDECHIPYTVLNANSFNVQRVYGRRQNPKWSVQHDMYSMGWST